MRISLATWTAHKEYLCDIRRRVFIEEQKVPEELEWDEHDATAIHMVALDGNKPIACVRIVQEGVFGYIGRMAVLVQYRKQGVGRILLNAAEDYAAKTLKMVTLRANVQTHAYGFYQSLGYEPDSAFNLDAGIVHIGMKKTLTSEINVCMDFIPGHDSHYYSFDNPIAGTGLLHIASRQRLHGLYIQIPDLRAPNLPWKYADTLSGLTAFMRYSSRREMKILLGCEYAGIADHPFMQWQQRLSSRVEVRIHSEVRRHRVILQPYGLIDTLPNKVEAFLNERVRAVKAQSEFDDFWLNSQPSKEGRRLKI